MDDEDRTPRRTWLAAERTFLAWWRTGLATAVSAIAVGRVLPEVVQDDAGWPYAANGIGYAVGGVGVFYAGARRHRQIDAGLRDAEFRPLSWRLVLGLSLAGVALTIATMALILAS